MMPFRSGWQLHILASYFTDEQLDNALSSTYHILRDSPLTPRSTFNTSSSHSTSNCSAKSKSSAARLLRRHSA